MNQLSQYDKDKRWLVYFYDADRLAVTAINKVEAMETARNQRTKGSELRVSNVEQLSE